MSTMKARIFKSHQRIFQCQLETGEMVEATALGNLLKNEENIVVGDYVLLDANKTITEVLPRTTEIFRRLVREKKKKVTAANCDVMVILSSVSKPEYKRGIVDRFLVRAHQWGIRPLVVFNKMDEYTPGSVDLDFERERLEEIGVECFEMSATNPNYQPQYFTKGFNDLKNELKNKTSIFLGQSGVGKSKAISALTQIKIELLSRDVGKIGKGTHTTTWSEIIATGEFAIIDSPGIRSFGVDDLLETELLSLFPDVEEATTRCKFSNCEHAENSKGCYFNSLDLDDQKTKIIYSRLDSYLKMLEEIRQVPDYLKKS